MNVFEELATQINRSIGYDKDALNIYLGVLREELERGIEQSQLPQAMFFTLILLYGLMICIGAIGNAMVIGIVVASRVMRSSPRNLFILNLAVSDLTLCLFTHPLNLLRLFAAYQEWRLGLVLCKLTSVFQGTNVYVSSMSITAVALDRFHVSPDFGFDSAYYLV
ncbi:unnamed protein product [Protopolystoma xenopodis]|uniref:G-protein coupled receptors family 1 profile domain-containing protein n=1 Tax=Protopolystoma xenopodis TaxID=117903 RepID=A0A3S5CKF6_9PLAT|nr:unnamed protein product [Protopolystoma xenopodis]